MPTGPQYSADMYARRRRINFSVYPPVMKHAGGAWKWAYENHVTDEPTFTDWINHVITAYADAPDIDSSFGGAQGRMFWIDRDKAELLPEPGDTPNRSQFFRAAVAAAVADIQAEADRRGEEIPAIERLPARVYRS